MNCFKLFCLLTVVCAILGISLHQHNNNNNNNNIYVCILYLGQQFGQRFRRLKDGNSFHDVRYVWRKTWMPFSTRSRRIFTHVDVSFSGTPCHFDRLPILVLAELISFEPFDKHKKHSIGSRKTRGHSGHLLKGGKRPGE